MIQPCHDGHCKTSPITDGGAPKPVTLTVRGHGHVPSFKNNKSLFQHPKTKKLFIATKPERKRWMAKVIRDFESQLLSAFQTAGPGTRTAELLRSWIAQSLPWDDSGQWLREINIKVVEVPKGSEGAELTIEQIQPP